MSSVPHFLQDGLLNKMKLRHAARTDERALRQYNLAADRTAAGKEQADQGFYFYNSDFMTS